MRSLLRSQLRRPSALPAPCDIAFWKDPNQHKFALAILSIRRYRRPSSVDRNTIGQRMGFATIHLSPPIAEAVKNLLASQNGHILVIVFLIALSSLSLAFLTAAASSKCSSATALRIALAHTSLISESNVPRNFSLSNISLLFIGRLYKRCHGISDAVGCSRS